MVSICRSGGCGEQVPVCLETGLFTQIKKNRKENIDFDNANFAPYNSVCRTNNWILRVIRMALSQLSGLSRPLWDST